MGRFRVSGAGRGRAGGALLIGITTALFLVGANPGTSHAEGLASGAQGPQLGVSAPQARFDFDTTPGRLSKAIRPTHTALTLTLDPSRDDFSGSVTTQVTVRNPVPEISLHAHQLTAIRAQLGNGRALRIEPDESSQIWRLVPDDALPIPAGNHDLQIDYSGIVNQTDNGLYRAPYLLDGKPASMLATQLEAIFARQLFPAFDEPAFRSVFEITVNAPQGLAVFSNMPVVKQTDRGQLTRHQFAPTPPMPSYLVAVAVGHFDILNGQAGGVTLRILMAPGKRDLGAYALASTQKILPYYNAYFGIDYALPKLDQLAVPSTREGAMEDWGLISYSESALLFDPASSDLATRRGIFSTVAHEIAHQWFGNWVTAASWEEIWLNEAFATWMAEKATAHFNPDWQVPLHRRQPIDQAMIDDAGPATRAIRSGPVDENKVFDVFDAITYEKGGAVLSMLENWLGTEAFRRGLAGYMRERQLTNATAADLWFHIGQASGQDVQTVATSWTEQKGFPLVRIESQCQSTGSTRATTRVQLTQQRFSNDPNAPDQSERWQIPLVLQHDGQTHTRLMTEARSAFELPGCAALPPILNPDGQGFYRVAYEPRQHQALARQFSQLSPAQRIVFLSDTIALAQRGDKPISEFLELLPQLANAPEPGRAALIGVARQGLLAFDDALWGTPPQDLLRRAARAFLQPELAALGWAGPTDEDSEHQILRSALIADLARYEDPATLAKARQYFDDEQAGRQPIPVPIRAAIISATGRAADPMRFNQLLIRLQNAPSEEDRGLFAYALAAVPDPALAQQALELSLRGVLPNNIAARLPGLVAGHAHHANLAYQFTLAHYPALAKIAGDMFGASSWLLPQAAAGFSSPQQARQLILDQARLVGEKGATYAALTAARIELKAAIRARSTSPDQSLSRANLR